MCIMSQVVIDSVSQGAGFAAVQPVLVQVETAVCLPMCSCVLILCALCDNRCVVR
jgi:hypothetical protein